MYLDPAIPRGHKTGEEARRQEVVHSMDFETKTRRKHYYYPATCSKVAVVSTSASKHVKTVVAVY